MTMRAAEDALNHLLADPTVADVRLAGTLKWLFIGIAMLAIAMLALQAAARSDMAAPRNWLRTCCGCASLAGMSLLYRAFHQSPTLNLVTLSLFVVSLAAVGAMLWRITVLYDPVPIPPSEATAS